MAEELWAIDPMPDKDLGARARAIVAEIETSGLQYSEKILLIGQVFAAVSANEIAKTEKRSKGKINARSMRESLIMYFLNQCKMQLAAASR